MEQIKGRVVDEHQKPLPFANVVLISSVSKAYVAGCVTAEDGSFVLPYADKDVMLKVSFVGYKSQTLACKPTMHIGLHPDTQQLKAVTIKITRPNVVYKDGAFTTLVSGTILGELGSAEDMISQLPFVSGEAGGWGNHRSWSARNLSQRQETGESERTQAIERQGYSEGRNRYRSRSAV